MATEDDHSPLGLPVQVDCLTKSFGPSSVALRNVSLRIEAGEMVALIGASGSGKSTLLRHLPGFLAADAGPSVIQVGPHEIQKGGIMASQIRKMRVNLGVVFQQFNLVGRLDVLTNVLIGLLPRVPWWRSWLGRFTVAEKAEALAALKLVGLAEAADRRASTLSGGQQQRVAIARCLVQQARVILADEPIASLDPESARNVMEILARINRERGVTVIVSLHQVSYARHYCPRVLALRAGEIVYDGAGSGLTSEALKKLYGSSAEELLDDAITLST